MSMEAALLESRTLRSGLCERTEVLDEVKALVLLADGLHVTTRMVADYFGVSEPAIYSLLRRHREELESNGFTVLRPVENPADQTFKTNGWQVSGPQSRQQEAQAGDPAAQPVDNPGNQKCKVNFWQVGGPQSGQPHTQAGGLPARPVDNPASQSDKTSLWQVSGSEGLHGHPSGAGHRPTVRGAAQRPQGGGNGVALYSRRAVLNVAMLLRDSEVARAVRSRLLDLIEGAARPAAGPAAVYAFPARPWKRWSELRWDEEEAVRRDPAVAAWRRRIDGLEPFEACLPAVPPAGEEPEDLPGVVAELAEALGSVDRRLEAQGVVISAISVRIARQESRLDAHGGRLDALSEDVRAIRRDVALLRRRRRG
ncbi:hypothetical protein ACIHEI_07845 [Kitasatospora sp. NPDC051984]|uniref:hypothetical protein n=1 Tax=Kitasatospora sp. NPDC051984 TaxID=3364059 RepID=UPI0037C534A7